ncbi:MAG: trypsin-like peptidase domain-containing protein [Planctomycetota bacterium]
MNMRTSLPTVVALAGVVVAVFAVRAQSQTTDRPVFDPETLEQAGESLRDLLGSVLTPGSLYADGQHVRSAFRESVATAREATVRVRVDGQNRQLGGVVGPDGWVLTKASRLANAKLGSVGRVTVRLSDGRELDARTVGVDRAYDLAMLKIDAKDLPTLDLQPAVEPAPGDWVATVGVGRDPLAVGVVSVLPRKIAHRPGILGIQLADRSPDHPGALVVRVLENTGAEAAGVLANDVVTSINDTRVRTRVELIETVRKFSPGDTLDVGIWRAGETLTLAATLTGRNRVSRMWPMSRSEYQNSLGGDLSERRFGFPSAIQHDTALEASECGGPLVDIDGRVVGFNLARSGRTESYAVPTAELPERLFALMNGSQPPGASN